MFTRIVPITPHLGSQDHLPFRYASQNGVCTSMHVCDGLGASLLPYAQIKQLITTYEFKYWDQLYTESRHWDQAKAFLPQLIVVTCTIFFDCGVCCCVGSIYIASCILL